MVDDLEITDRSFVFCNGARLGVARRPGGFLLRLSYGCEELAIELTGDVGRQLARWVDTDEQSLLAMRILQAAEETYGADGRVIAVKVLTVYGKLDHETVAAACNLSTETVGHLSQSTKKLPVDAEGLVKQVLAWKRERKKKRKKTVNTK